MMSVKFWDMLTKRFVVFSIVQALVLCLCIFLSVNHFGGDGWQRTKSVALILASPKDTEGWPREIALGMQQACDELGYELYIEDEVAVGSDACHQVIEKLIARGVKRIFLANPGYQKEVEVLARKYPQVSFFANSAGETVSDEILNYSVRYYDVRYLSGVLAGLHTKTGIVGYAAPFPAAETRRDLNAFALGVQSVRPDARILFRWTGQWISPAKEHEAVYLLKMQGADVMGYFAATQAIAAAAEEIGMDYIDFHRLRSGNAHCIAAIETDWRMVYTELLRMNRRSEGEHVYWKGLFDDVVCLHLQNGALTPREEALVGRARSALWSGQQIFSGNIIDQSGSRRCMEGEVISNSDVRTHMDWLVRGVESIESK